MRWTGLLLPIILSTCFAAAAWAADEDLRLSSIGYVPDSAKHATVLGTASASFTVHRQSDDSAAFSGSLTAVGGDGLADFSELEEPGSFYLRVDGVGRSPDFVIAESAYVEPYRTAMLGLYAWRSGVDVSFTYEGQTYSHAAGHTDDARLDFVGQPGVVKDATGGWYDAGDYGKYIVNSAITMGALLKAWEDFRLALEPVELQLPPSMASLPDYLEELRYQLDWMQKMQFADGRVSHKLTPVDFAGFVMPADDDSVRYLSPWGSAATAGFVATMAKASRSFATHDPTYATELLAAAELSYEFLNDNLADHRPDLSDFANAQYQTDDPDDRIWAAAEMWEATGSDDALADFEARVGAFDYEVPLNWDWGDQSNLGVFTYLESTRAGRDPNVVNALESALQTTANSLAQNASSTYGRGIEEVYWGSNGTVARNCITLRVAAQLFNDPRYVAACADQVAHLFGRNEYNRSQVTGVGANPPMNPHDRRSGSDGIAAPYPGYLVGGASRAGNWQDVEESYETNEIAINWQGALVYALAGFLPTTAATGGNGGAGGTTGSGGDDPANAGRGGQYLGGATGRETGGAGNSAGVAGNDPSGGAANDGGCACRARQAPRTGPTWMLAALAGIGGVARRRSSRRRDAT